MEQRRFGRSGLVVSSIGLGCNNFGRAGSATADLEGCRAVVAAALAEGITFFDCADTYPGRDRHGRFTPGVSEELLGQTLRGVRDDVVVATKFGLDVAGLNGRDVGARGGRRYVRRAVEGSLRRLGTDRIDLLQLHTPDPLTPVEETLSVLDDLVREGKVLYIGHSNMDGWRIAQAEYVARAQGTTRFVTSQNHYNLLDRRAELEVLPAAVEFGLGVIPYFPLAGGLLTGKYTSGSMPAGTRATLMPTLLDGVDLEQLQRFGKFCAERGVTETAVAIGWLSARPAVTSVIAGATRVEQVVSNARSTWRSTSQDLEELDTIFPSPERVALY